METKKQVPELLNFTKVADGIREQTTSIWIYTGYEKSEWMRLGAFQLVPRDSHHFRGLWMFEALIENTTDFEHSNARLVRLELVGVHMHMHLYGITHIDAFISGDVDGFRVPRADYDPRKLPGATMCKNKSCGKPHSVVPEGCYVPKINEELHAQVSGRRIEIKTGRAS